MVFPNCVAQAQSRGDMLGLAARKRFVVILRVQYKKGFQFSEKFIQFFECLVHKYFSSSFTRKHLYSFLQCKTLPKQMMKCQVINQPSINRPAIYHQIPNHQKAIQQKSRKILFFFVIVKKMTTAVASLSRKHVLRLVTVLSLIFQMDGSCWSSSAMCL